MGLTFLPGLLRGSSSHKTCLSAASNKSIAMAVKEQERGLDVQLQELQEHVAELQRTFAAEQRTRDAEIAAAAASVRVRVRQAAQMISAKDTIIKELEREVEALKRTRGGGSRSKSAARRAPRWRGAESSQ